MFKKISFIFAVVLISGLSSIMAEHYLFPYLATTKFFSRYEFIKKSAENVTVINKTEQVYVKEESSLSKVVGQITPSIVNIISYGKENDAKNGTGQIATSDGIIITYISAIRTDDASYKVMLNDGNVLDANLLGVDPWSNLAFIKVNASNLPVIPFSEDGKYKPGEKIISIGNDMPIYQNGFSSGILIGYDPTFNISGKTLSVAEKLEGVYFSDLDGENLAAGGPVIDYSGKVIGIVGNITKDGKEVFFQIPTAKIKQAMNKAIRKELDSIPTLGIYYKPITKTLAIADNLPTSEGAIIYSPSKQQGLAVLSGTPAAKAGLAISDIITHVGGEKINLDNNLSDIFYNHKKGDRIEFTVIRKGQEIKAELQL